MVLFLFFTIFIIVFCFYFYYYYYYYYYLDTYVCISVQTLWRIILAKDPSVLVGILIVGIRPTRASAPSTGHLYSLWYFPEAYKDDL